MPLSENVRIEVYIPDLPAQAYRLLLETLEREFSFTFGGCTIIRGLERSYLSQVGTILQDRVNVIYTDAPFSIKNHRESIGRYVAEIRAAADEALEEEAILVTAMPIFHAEPL